MKIGGVAERAGLSVKMIRCEEAQGLIPPAARNAGGFRTFSEDHVQVFRCVRRIRDQPSSAYSRRLMPREWGARMPDIGPLGLGWAERAIIADTCSAGDTIWREQSPSAARTDVCGSYAYARRSALSCASAASDQSAQSTTRPSGAAQHWSAGSDRTPRGCCRRASRAGISVFSVPRTRAVA